MAWGMLTSDTSELLRQVDSAARESYYRTSSSRLGFYVVAVVLFLALSLIGLWLGGPYRYVFIFAGILGLVLVSVWISLHW